MQLKHYNRWRKRVQEDPYKAIFGASSDMLNGKGLIDWEWINKSFPKWMLNEVDVSEPSQGKHDQSTTAREPIFPQPSFRKQTLDRDGVKSPSDSRRPQEGAYVKVVGKAPSDPPNEASASFRSHISTVPERIENSSTSAPSDFVSSATQVDPQEMVQKEETADIPKDEAAQSVPPQPRIRRLAQRELEFWDDQTHQHQQKSDTDWRLTALQRRLGRPHSSRKQLSLEAERLGYPSLDPSAITTEEADGKPQGLRLDNRTSANGPVQKASRAWLELSTQGNDSSTRSTSEKLKQLPEDDIDFLSAADIRASMGAKRSWLPSDEQKQASRQNLEQAFSGSEDTSSIHPMLEARIVNNQYVRRTERKLRDGKRATNKEAEDLEKTSVVEPVPEIPTEVPAEAPAESSIERMKRWLETTGASFAKTFWQDPTEEADVTKTKLFFDKVAHYVKKGQAANRQITEDLEKDIPVSKPLLSRLKSDEERLDLAIHRLRQRTSNGQTQDLSPKKIRAMESLKARYHQTNRELETAYEALRDAVGTDAVVNATASFKRRLSTASKVLHKNSQLLRMLIWSLQTRLEDPKIDRKILPNYKVVADNLLSLRDTQMTLMRLVDRAMLVYGADPGGRADNDTPRIKLEDFENCEDPFVRARLAADVHLINEIKAHKSRSQEPANESSCPSPNPSNSKILDEPSPLSNSLFRPFGPVIEKLGNKELREMAAEEVLLEEKRKLGDVKLIDDIKAAYEDTYGAITADHRQIPFKVPGVKGSPMYEPLDAQEAQQVIARLKKVKKVLSARFDMLKDDPASTQVSATETSSAGATLSGPDSAHSGRAAEAPGNPPAENLVKDIDATPSKDATAAESTKMQAQRESPPAATATSHPSLQAVHQTEDQVETAPSSALEQISTHYTIVVRDPETDTLSITTSTIGPPRDTSPAVPLHLALSSLDKPAKFIPYITEGLEVVSAKKDILVLRDAVENDNSTRPFSTVAPSSSTVGSEHAVFNHGATNPIDGTTRLSPTGYVGPEESAEQLEKDFLERRSAADRLQQFKNDEPGQVRHTANRWKARRRGRAGSVVKTAIWVAGMCYIAGVIGEICT